ncbi:Similar to mars1: Methionine--tRNA ligase [Cotesia congregata]|uniref:Methionine--tRNA ligase, cytoplasmic n=1 Tax=Cotesia congregata TaxID=51543 RepID=A0A8J2GZC4_COTCN|nr:Similar to mars1: Methionine--tRNA ligase [Cotesia congregata]
MENSKLTNVPQENNLKEKEEELITEEELQAVKSSWLNKTQLTSKKLEYPVLPKKGERNILITSALPYVNNVPHLGNIIGCVLSADIFARFCRQKNYNTLYVSGTDEYGTATEAKAFEEKMTCQEICDKYFTIHDEVYRWFNIAFDRFGRTSTKEQTEVVQQFFLRVKEQGYIFTDTVDQLRCEGCEKFLADRFVEGICPDCKYEDARGDQCDGCGHLINATELINPRCKLCNQTPVVKTSEHFFLDLPKKIKTFYNRINRMSLGVARNTPAYIIRQQVGIEHMEYIIKERALRFLADVVRMDDDRWTKICIKNEMREIMNKNPKKWGKTIEKFLQKIGIGELPKMIYKGCSSDDVEEKIKSGLENYKWMLDEKEEILIKKSTYNELYKNIKTEESNNYWKRDNIRSEDKETWARLRCGNIWRDGKKGQNNWGCRICEKEQETIIHIINCKEIHEKVTVEGKEAKNKWLEEPRCITRDIKWGIPVPLEGYEDKVFYVWFDAPLGYLSISKNYHEDYEQWWRPQPEMDVSLYQFMAKDNVPFHAIMFPASLLAANQGHVLVKSIMAVEYLNYEDTKFSKSRGVGVFGTDAKETGIPADVWRFYLAYVRPEGQDTNFNWTDLATKTNSELLNNFGNFVNRSLAFAEKNYEGIIQEMELRDEEYNLLACVQRELTQYNLLMEQAKLRDSLKLILSISKLGNQYLQAQQPWAKIKGDDNDKKIAGMVSGICCNLSCLLSSLIGPFMPAISLSLRAQLGFEDHYGFIPDTVTILLEPGHKIGKSSPLFARITDKEIQALREKFGGVKEEKPKKNKKTQKQSKKNKDEVADLQKSIASL